MSVKFTQRDALEAYLNLERAAQLAVAEPLGRSRKLDLHDAAVRYAAVIRRITRAGRESR